MRLHEALAGCRILNSHGTSDVEVLAVTHDSRQVKRGFVFTAIRGLKSDGNRFASQAVAAGAVAVVSESPAPVGIGIPWIQVDDDRAALAVLAANLNLRPTEKLQVIGVTGTNGKTTTTYLIESILKAAGHSAALFGTIEYRGPGFEVVAERTTPEAPELQAMFRRVADGGWKYAVMEVSSHAIQLKRVSGLHFDIAVFTNLTRDHLDLHGDMRSYFLAKKKLFTGLDGVLPRVLVLNIDDPCFEELKEIAPDRVISYGMGIAAGVSPVRYDCDQKAGANRMNAAFKSPAGDIEVSSKLIGKPNLYNIGAAIGASIGLGLPADAIRAGIDQLQSVPGRFELVEAGQGFRVVVDFAHTDDALTRVLQTAREITRGKLIVVFGCGGDRDKTKRPLMGEAAALGSDLAVVTSDNPRSEDPMEIIREVEVGLRKAGASPGSGYFAIADRRDAIRLAFSKAGAGDTVLLAGKGHETYQVMAAETFPFDDRVVARELLNELEAGRN
jgi:UDP-N-acetylmuramoyl-L-alanyl-D-glutamate--2,6-diaminopimelate ligase